MYVLLKYTLLGGVVTGECNSSKVYLSCLFAAASQNLQPI